MLQDVQIQDPLFYLHWFQGQGCWQSHSHILSSKYSLLPTTLPRVHHLRLDIRRNFFTGRIVKPLPREVVGSSFLEVFKRYGDVAPGAVFSGGLGSAVLRVGLNNLRGLFPHKQFCDSMACQSFKHSYPTDGGHEAWPQSRPVLPDATHIPLAGDLFHNFNSGWNPSPNPARHSQCFWSLQKTHRQLASHNYTESQGCKGPSRLLSPIHALTPELNHGTECVISISF